MIAYIYFQEIIVFSRGAKDVIAFTIIDVELSVHEAVIKTNRIPVAREMNGSIHPSFAVISLNVNESVSSVNTLYDKWCNHNAIHINALCGTITMKTCRNRTQNCTTIINNKQATGMGEGCELKVEPP